LTGEVDACKVLQHLMESLLYYHWGEKQDLYEAVIMDISDEIQAKLHEIERRVSGRSLTTRLEIALDMMCDYLFSYPEVPNLFLFGYFNKTGHGVTLDIKMSRYIAEIAIAMQLAANKKQVSIPERNSEPQKSDEC
jgi:AcrR family transcriptional regulator